MKYLYQNTMVPNAPGTAMTLNFTDDAGDSIVMFNAGVQTSVVNGVASATISKVDGKGNVLSDANGPLTETATGATTDAAIVAAMTALAPRVIPAPVISSVSPATGPVAGGTALTISGKNFLGTTGVTVGGVAATGVTVTNAGTQITCTTPAGTAGQQDVVVQGPLASATQAKAFTYE